MRSLGRRATAGIPGFSTRSCLWPISPVCLLSWLHMADFGIISLLSLWQLVQRNRELLYSKNTHKTTGLRFHLPYGLALHMFLSWTNHSSSGAGPLLTGFLQTCAHFWILPPDSTPPVNVSENMVGWCFKDSHVLCIHLRSLLKCGSRFSRSKAGPEILHF